MTLLGKSSWGFAGVPAEAGLTTLADGDSSLGYMSSAAFAATCLAQAKAPPKP